MSKLQGVVAVVAVAFLQCFPPKVFRPEEWRLVHRVPDVIVKLDPAGVAGWNLSVENRRDTQILVNWDASSFVAADGVGRGRLLRGQTRAMDSGKAQPKSPVPPHSTVVEFVIPETLADPAIKEPPFAVRKGIGRMFVAIDAADREDLWEASIYFEGDAPAMKPEPARPAIAPTDAGVDGETPPADAKPFVVDPDEPPTRR